MDIDGAIISLIPAAMGLLFIAFYESPNWLQWLIIVSLAIGFYRAFFYRNP